MLRLPVKGASPASCNSTWTAAPTAVATRRFFRNVVSISAVGLQISPCCWHEDLAVDFGQIINSYN